MQYVPEMMIVVQISNDQTELDNMITELNKIFPTNHPRFKVVMAPHYAICIQPTRRYEPLKKPLQPNVAEYKPTKPPPPISKTPQRSLRTSKKKSAFT
jgi:hypothetical protein